MFRHHPEFAETGELEIAQRQALQEALQVAVKSGGTEAAIVAYLAAMRRLWQPEAIEIEEGDYIVIEVDGKRVEVHANHGNLAMRMPPSGEPVHINITKRL